MQYYLMISFGSPDHIGSQLNFIFDPFSIKFLFKSRIINLQAFKMSLYQLDIPDIYISPSLNKGTRPQKYIIISNFLGSEKINILFNNLKNLTRNNLIFFYRINRN